MQIKSTLPLLIIFLLILLLQLFQVYQTYRKYKNIRALKKRELSLKKNYLISNDLNLKLIDQLNFYQIIRILLMQIVCSSTVLTINFSYEFVYMKYLKYKYAYNFISEDNLAFSSIIMAVILSNFVLIFSSRILFNKYKEKYLIFRAITQRIKNKNLLEKILTNGKINQETVEKMKKTNKRSFLYFGIFNFIFAIPCICYIFLSFNYYILYFPDKVTINPFFSFSEKSFKYSEIKKLTLINREELYNSQTSYHLRLDFDDYYIFDGLGFDNDIHIKDKLEFIKSIATNNKIQINYEKIKLHRKK